MYPNTGQPARYPNQSYGNSSQGQSYGAGSNPYGGTPPNQAGGYTGQSYVGSTASAPQQSAWNHAQSTDSEAVIWFQAVDVDRSGRISASELRQALTNSNWSLFSEEACRLMIGLFDRDHDRSIDLQEFQQLWIYIRQWHEMFNQVDQNKSGYIEHAELQQALATMGYHLSPQFMQVVIARFDITGKNKLTLDSFIMVCVILHQLTEAFKQKDLDRRGEVKVNYDDFLQMALLGIP